MSGVCNGRTYTANFHQILTDAHRALDRHILWVMIGFMHDSISPWGVKLNKGMFAAVDEFVESLRSCMQSDVRRGHLQHKIAQQSKSTHSGLERRQAILYGPGQIRTSREARRGVDLTANRSSS